MFRRLVATSRAPQIMVLSMLRSFGKIGPQIDQIWAWLSRGHRWSPGVRDPLKSLNTGLSLLVNCYLEIKFHKIIRVNPPPPPPPLTIDLKIIIRGKLSLGRTIYPGNSRRNNSPWDNLPRDNSPRAIFCLLL